MRQQCQRCPRRPRVMRGPLCMMCWAAEVKEKIGQGVVLREPSPGDDEKKTLFMEVLKRRVSLTRPLNWCKDDSRAEEMRVRELMGIQETEGDWE